MKIANQKISAERLVRDALEKAKHFADYNIFTSLDEEGALKKARAIDARIAKGEKVGRLAGVPFAVKDNFLTTGDETTASAHILNGFVAPFNATIIQKLEAEGAIPIGHTNMDTFGHGSSTENSYYGPTLNPYNKEYVPGGSSGGSAAAVALEIVEFATATDTGGSIRQPAAFSGVYGLKPTYGTNSRYGVIAMISSTDCVGYIAKDPADIDLLMSITAGQDPKDQTSLPDYYNDSKIDSGKKRIGIIKDFDNDVIAPEIRSALKKQCEKMVAAGHEVVELEMPTLKYALPVYYVICMAEISSNLSRYDGVRYGFRAEDSTNLDKLYVNTRGEGFMPESKRRIMIGNFVLSSGFYDAYFLKAAKARTLIINEYQKAFSQCDFILAPVAPSPPFKLGAKTSDPVSMYLEDLMTVPVSLAGVPGLTIPAGKTASGLPIGLQLVGPRRSDKNLLNFAKELQENA